MKPFLLLSMAGIMAAEAGLEWKNREVTLEVHPAQVYADAVFEFTNTGAEPAGVSNVIISCGCLSSLPVRDRYAPGESGTLTVRFNLRNRVGKQRKYVLVETGDEQPVELAVAVDIPRVYVADPTLAVWRKGDSDRQKTIRLVNPNAVPINLLALTSSHADLPAELITVREGFEYEVKVTRKPEARNARSVIRITTAVPPGLKESKNVKLYVYAE